MSCKFYVIMLKRDDGKLYFDLHKTNGKMYMNREEADAELAVYPQELRKLFHVVPIVGMLEEEYGAMMATIEFEQKYSKGIAELKDRYMEELDAYKSGNTNE